MKEIYMHNVQYAIENGERTEYFESRNENIRCKIAVEEAIGENFDGSYLNPDCIYPVIEEFGWERVRGVIGCSVYKLRWDGRFSKDNKEWASAIAEELKNTAFVEQDPVTSHPVIFNAFINLCRKAENEWRI